MTAYKELSKAIEFAKRYFHESKIWITSQGKYEVDVASKISVPKSWKILMHIQEGRIISFNKKFNSLPRSLIPNSMNLV